MLFAPESKLINLSGRISAPCCRRDGVTGLRSSSRFFVDGAVRSSRMELRGLRWNLAFVVPSGLSIGAAGSSSRILSSRLASWVHPRRYVVVCEGSTNSDGPRQLHHQGAVLGGARSSHRWSPVASSTTSSSGPGSRSSRVWSPSASSMASSPHRARELEGDARRQLHHRRASRGRVLEARVRY